MRVLKVAAARSAADAALLSKHSSTARCSRLGGAAGARRRSCNRSAASRRTRSPPCSASPAATAPPRCGVAGSALAGRRSSTARAPTAPTRSRRSSRCAGERRRAALVERAEPRAGRSRLVRPEPGCLPGWAGGEALLRELCGVPDGLGATLGALGPPLEDASPSQKQRILLEWAVAECAAAEAAPLVDARRRALLPPLLGAHARRGADDQAALQAAALALRLAAVVAARDHRRARAPGEAAAARDALGALLSGDAPPLLPGSEDRRAGGPRGSRVEEKVNPLHSPLTRRRGTSPRPCRRRRRRRTTGRGGGRRPPTCSRRRGRRCSSAGPCPR